MIDIGALANATNQAIFGTSNLIQSQVNANRANRQQILNLQTQAMLNEMSANAADRRTRMLWQDLQSPAAMVQQYKEAGLNPGLMYGQSGASGSLMAGAQSHGVGMPQAIMAENVPLLNADAANMMAEYNKTMAEIANIQADTNLKEKDLPIKDQMLENLKQEVTESRQRVNESMEKINLMFAQRMKEYQETNNLKAQKELTEAQKELTKAQNTLTSMQISFEPERQKAQLKEMEASAASLYAAARKMGAEAETINAMRQSLVSEQVWKAADLQFKVLALNPKEYDLLTEQTKQILLSNGEKEGVLEAYKSWKKKANHDRILDWLNFAANAAKAASGGIGAAALLLK